MNIRILCFPRGHIELLEEQFPQQQSQLFGRAVSIGAATVDAVVGSHLIEAHRQLLVLLKRPDAKSRIRALAPDMGILLPKQYT